MANSETLFDNACVGLFSPRRGEVSRSPYTSVLIHFSARLISYLMSWVPVIIVISCAFALWKVFYPGTLSWDSCVQYRQARLWAFDDAHPPVMALILGAIMRLGGDVQHVTLGQSVAGLLGVYVLSKNCIRIVFAGRFSPATMRLLALGVVLTLLNPISALHFYMMTFWKDVWLLISFCWLAALWLSMTGSRDCIPNRTYVLKLFAFLGVTVLAVLVRHNAIFVLPSLSLLFALIVYRKASYRLAIMSFFLPTVVVFLARYSIATALRVTQYHHENLVLAFDLTGLCYYYPDVPSKMPWTAQHVLAGNYRDTYCPGDINRSGPACIAHPGDQQIRKEYAFALTHYPMRLLRVKYEHFRYHFNAKATNRAFLYCSAIEEDAKKMGLKMNERFAGLRAFLGLLLSNTFHSWRRWFFVDHRTWVLACVGMLAAGLVCRRRNSGLWAIGLFLPVPLLYYCSYFLASLALDFRFMYPSDLVIQVVCLACVYGTLAAGAIKIGRVLGIWHIHGVTMPGQQE